MKKIFSLVVFAFLGCCLQANASESLSVKENKTVVADTTNPKQVKMNLQDLMKMAGANGGKPAFRLIQNIHDPRILSTTNKAVGVKGYQFIGNDSCIIFLEVEKCKGRLSGIDTSGYIQSEENRYKNIKLQDGRAIPADAGTEITWDPKKTTILGVMFHGIKFPKSQELEVVFSRKDPKALKIKTRFERREQTQQPKKK